LTSKIIFGIIVSGGDKNEKTISSNQGSQISKSPTQVGGIHQGIQPDEPEFRH
jgi:hypothetical protein